MLVVACSGGGEAVQPEVPASETAKAARVPCPRICQMGKLKGRKFSGLFTQYTGISGTVAEEHELDFGAQLAQMWSSKGTHYPDNPVIPEVGDTLVREYDGQDVQRMTIEEYRADIGQSLLEFQINWDEFARIKKLDASELKVAQAAIRCINGRMLIAYANTELMPGDNGELNLDVMDMLLRCGGTRYVYSVPALYDDRVSFGPYQFTSYAIYDTPHEKRGASIVANAVTGEKIPGSVAQLRGRNHHRAAFLFAAANIADMVRKIPDKRLAALERELTSDASDLVEYIAAAHHAPSRAITAARYWADNGFKEPLRISMSSRIRAYATKTQANYKAACDRFPV
jgi:hypothetical protein